VHSWCMCASERGCINLDEMLAFRKKYRHFEKVHEDFSGKEKGEEEEVVCEGPESGCAASVFVLFVPVRQVN
jgi:hypothetical protein